MFKNGLEFCLSALDLILLAWEISRNFSIINWNYAIHTICEHKPFEVGEDLKFELN